MDTIDVKSFLLGMDLAAHVCRTATGEHVHSHMADRIMKRRRLVELQSQIQVVDGQVVLDTADAPSVDLLTQGQCQHPERPSTTPACPTAPDARKTSLDVQAFPYSLFGFLRFRRLPAAEGQALSCACAFARRILGKLLRLANCTSSPRPDINSVPDAESPRNILLGAPQ